MKVWSKLCQASSQPPAPEFKEVYPYMTLTQGNRFFFRGGDPKTISEKLRTLLQRQLGSKPIQTHVE
jgi:hypothetical protein